MRLVFQLNFLQFVTSKRLFYLFKEDSAMMICPFSAAWCKRSAVFTTSPMTV